MKREIRYGGPGRRRDAMGSGRRADAAILVRLLFDECQRADGSDRFRAVIETQLGRSADPQ